MSYIKEIIWNVHIYYRTCKLLSSWNLKMQKWFTYLISKSFLSFSSQKTYFRYSCLSNEPVINSYIDRINIIFIVSNAMFLDDISIERFLWDNIQNRIIFFGWLMNLLKHNKMYWSIKMTAMYINIFIA